MNTIFDTKTLSKRIVPITYARRRFGELEKDILDLGVIILTKNGYPFVELRAIKEKTVSNAHRFAKCAGALKGTIFDNDKVVNEILKRKSRKKAIIF